MGKKLKNVKCFFLDSGAFTLQTTAIQYYREYGGKKWAFYDTPEFWNYMDDYVRFIKRNKIAIDLYANVDVIPEPELTWRNQQYLESKGLKPVPVVHSGTDIKWLQHYVNRGYKLIGLGGLVGKMKRSMPWLDAMFSYLCATSDRKPIVDIHGFGVTNFTIMSRYPWYSIDNTSYSKAAAYGGVYVPQKRNGEFVFNRPPYVLKVSEDSPAQEKKGSHYLTISGQEKEIITEWMSEIGIPIGENGEDGIITNHWLRRRANMLLLQRLSEYLTENPPKFEPRRTLL